jgi:hypothetical protein
MLLALLAAMMVASGTPAMGQIATTTVQDTVYSANGTPATGSVVVSWNAFTTASGQAVAAGSTSATIGAGGVLTMSLAPNAGATPMGSYYTAVFHLGDGTISREYWVVPVTVPGGGPATLAAIKNEVLPASVAMQTVSKQYVDQAIAAAALGAPLDASPYVLKAGDTMTGPLVLPADPVSTNQAADKHYVDASVAAVSGGAGQKVSTVPVATQVVAQPAGTQLDVNLLNGEVYASQYVNGTGTNGISNALASPDCAAGCKLMVEPTYQGADQVAASTFGSYPNGTKTEDQRGGANVQTVVNPLAYGVSSSGAQSFVQTETLSVPQLEVLRPSSSSAAARTLALSMKALTGGSNQLASGAPYGKSTYGALTMSGVYNTQGQHVQAGTTEYCYGVGDCLAGSQYMYSSGGYRDAADEGAHPFDLFLSEDTTVFAGTCATGCATGATSLKVSATAGGGSQGDGRFLIDTNAAKVITTGTLTGGGKTSNGTNYGMANFTGTSFPVSVFLSTAQAATSQAKNIAPGTVTLAIATSGVPAGFATSTAALSASSGVACVADVQGTAPTPYYEMANYTVVDATHLQLTLNKVHATGATVAVGGLCGYGLEQTVDTTGGIRQLFPVIGSYDATDLYYADGQTTALGLKNSTSTTGYVNVSLTVTGISRSSNVVTVTTSGTVPGDLNGLSLTVSGVADSSYNGTFVVTTTAANTFTYSSTGANSTSSGGTVTLLTGGYVLYPMAEVLSVYNAATGSVDGTMTLAANTVAWATGDTVEEPHFYQQRTYPDTEYVTQYVPRPQLYTSAGKTYQGTVGPGVRGWQVTNGAPASQYLGAGGTHNLPDYAYVVAGAWNRDFDVQAGNQAVIWAHCNLNGCNRWDSTYSLFALDSAVGYGADGLSYAPQSSTATWRVGGATYSFSPTSFTAGTINVGTLNATTITGGVSGAAITSGTVSAARLPVFGPSGTSHAAGIVPDPGGTAGATRYLREDGNWAAPVPAQYITYVPAAPCDNGTPLPSGLVRVGTQGPQPICLAPATSSAGAFVFAAGSTVPQYVSSTIVIPTNWTGTSLYLKFAGSATTGNVGWTVDAACSNDGQVISAQSFGAATTITTSVSATPGASVTTAVFANIGVPGSNGCQTGTTAPGSLLTYRIHRSATDTQSGVADLLGVIVISTQSR